jgi:50S ribosomal protein L16 3-hydroxylase
VRKTTRALQLDLGISQAQFLAQYWQRKPLLIQHAFQQFASPITPNDLAGVATEVDSLARLVQWRNRRWSTRNGPFSAADFAALPKRDWTLLVQDCDKWFVDIAAVKDCFDFIPNWRLDDVMVSFAAPGGSVGAHVDQYDVFLLQAKGSRRWQIDDRPGSDATNLPNAPLKLLKNFTPNREWILQPGDMLYLPPGIPHHGVAVDECLTFSIGFRAPSARELWLDWLNVGDEQNTTEPRFADPGLELQESKAGIGPKAIGRLRQAMSRALTQSDLELAQWFAIFLSRYRAGRAYPTGKPIARGRQNVLTDAKYAGSILVRDPYVRCAYVQDDRGATLCVAGEQYQVGAKFAQAFCAQSTLPLATWQKSQRDLACIAILNQRGCIRITRRARAT